MGKTLFLRQAKKSYLVLALDTNICIYSTFKKTFNKTKFCFLINLFLEKDNYREVKPFLSVIKKMSIKYNIPTVAETKITEYTNTIFFVLFF